MSMKIPISGKEIKKSLIDKGITQSALAKGLNISVYYVRDICNDHRIATEMRQKIVSYLSSLGDQNAH